MKCHLFRLLTIVFSVVAMAVFANSAMAQGKGGKGGGGGGGNGGGDEPPAEAGIGYRVHWPDLPPETLGVYPQNFAFATDTEGNGTVALVVGYYQRSDRSGRSAFVYDHFGLIDNSRPRKFWDIFELIGPSFPTWVPSTHEESAFFGVNSSGQVCGYVRSGVVTDHIACKIDLNQDVLSLDRLPDFYTDAAATIGWRVNEAGDVLLIGTRTGDFRYETEISVYNPVSDHLIHVQKNISEPYYFYGVGWHEIEFNSLRQIVGTSALGTSRGPLLRYVVSEDATDSNGFGLAYVDGGDSAEFDDISRPTAINEFGQFGADSLFSIRRNKTELRASRINVNGLVEWSQKIDYLAYGPYVDDINDSGDLVWQDQDNLGVSYYLHEGDPTVSGDETFVQDFESLIIADSDPLGVFATSDLQLVRVSDRDISDYGWIFGNVQVGTNSDGSDHKVLAILIPEILP